MLDSGEDPTVLSRKSYLQDSLAVECCYRDLMNMFSPLSSQLSKHLHEIAFLG